MTSIDNKSPTHAPSMIQLGQRLLADIALVTSAILAVWLWVTWEQTQTAQIARMANTVKLLRDLGVDWELGWYFGRPECELDPVQKIQLARTGT